MKNIQETDNEKLKLKGKFTQNTSKKKDTEPSEVKGNLRNKIILQSALDQWTIPIKNLIDRSPPNGEYEISCVNWKEMRMDKCLEVIRDPNNVKELKLKREISDEDTEYKLHVFVAPITWAGMFCKTKGFSIIGPAFGTSDDLSIFVRNDLQHKSNELIKVGLVCDDITSTIMFKILLCYSQLFNNILHTKIHQQFRDHIKKQVDIEIKFKEYDFQPIDDEFQRIEWLNNKSGLETLDFAIFTKLDIENIKKDGYFSTMHKKEILKIDKLLSHLFNIYYVPRSVYCVHNSQLANPHFYKLYQDFKNWIDKAVTELKEKEIIEGFYAINPTEEHDRTFQRDFVNITKEKFKIAMHNIEFE